MGGGGALLASVGRLVNGSKTVKQKLNVSSKMQKYLTNKNVLYLYFFQNNGKSAVRHTRIQKAK